MVSRRLVAGYYDEIRLCEVPPSQALVRLNQKKVDLLSYPIVLGKSRIQPANQPARVIALNSAVMAVFNPAPGENELNVFSIKKFRQFVAYHLIDRKRIVDEILEGEGEPMWVLLDGSSPDYSSVEAAIRLYDSNEYQKRHWVPKSVEEILIRAGASLENDSWHYQGRRVSVNFLIRTDNRYVRQIGEILGRDLDALGIQVNRIFVDRQSWEKIGYGTDPRELQWQVGFQRLGKEGNIKYITDALYCYLYGTWSGTNPPSLKGKDWWRYTSRKLDTLTKRLYGGAYKTILERNELVAQIATIALEEATRTFIVGIKGSFLFNKDTVDPGLIRDPYAGPATFFWAHTIKPPSLTHGRTLTVGVHKLHSSPYNKIGGFSDSSSLLVYTAVHDHGVLPNPLTGLWTPFRFEWRVSNKGPKQSVEIPNDALRYDWSRSRFVEIGQSRKCVSSVELTYRFGAWHHGELQNMNDVMWLLRFAFKWANKRGPNDPFYDATWASLNSEVLKKLVAFKVLGPKQIQLFLDYWHPEQSEVGAWVHCWPWYPWELMMLIEQIVAQKKLALNRVSASSHDLPVLDLVQGPSLGHLRQALCNSSTEELPEPMNGLITSGERESRFSALDRWVQNREHFMIMAGPYYFHEVMVPSKIERLRSIRFLGSAVTNAYPLALGEIQRNVALTSA